MDPRQPPPPTAATRTYLTWHEAVAHGRLLRLAAHMEAIDGLREKPRSVPAHLAGLIRWTRDPSTGKPAAEIRDPSGDTGTLTEQTSTAGARLYRHDSNVEHDVVVELCQTVEHRRYGWQIWDPNDPTLHTDQVRIILSPLTDESAAERGIVTAVETQPNLDGTLSASSARIRWISETDEGLYPDERHPAPNDELRETIDRLRSSAAKLTALFSVHAVLPETPIQPPTKVRLPEVER